VERSDPDGQRGRDRANVLRTPTQVRETLTALEQQGCQELCLWPLATGAAQVDRLAEAALS
jgi:hypothetical protein